jgi:hypothetical protein
MARATEFFRELQRLRPHRKLDDLKVDDYERLQDEITRIYGSAEGFRRALDAEGLLQDDSDVMEAEEALPERIEAELEGLEAEGASPERIEAAIALSKRIEAAKALPEGLEAKGASPERIEAAIALSERIEAAKALPEGLEADRPSRDVVEALPLRLELDPQAQLERRGVFSQGTPIADLQAAVGAGAPAPAPAPASSLGLGDSSRLFGQLNPPPPPLGQRLAAASTSVDPQLLFAGDAAARALPRPPPPPAGPPTGQFDELSGTPGGSTRRALPDPPLTEDQLALLSGQPSARAAVSPGQALLPEGPRGEPQLPVVPSGEAQLAVGPSGEAQLAAAPGTAVQFPEDQPQPPPMLANRMLRGARPSAAPAAVPAAARGREPLIDFKENPLGAIGLVLSNIAAGYQGRELPTTKLRRIRAQEDAAAISRIQVSLNLQEQILKQTAHLTGDAREAAITRLAGPAAARLGGQSFIDGILAAAQPGPAFSPSAHKELAIMVLGPGGSCAAATDKGECFRDTLKDDSTRDALYAQYDRENAGKFTAEFTAVLEMFTNADKTNQLRDALEVKYDGLGNMPINDFVQMLNEVQARTGRALISPEAIASMKRNPGQFGFIDDTEIQAKAIADQLAESLKPSDLATAQKNFDIVLNKKYQNPNELGLAYGAVVKASGGTFGATAIPAFVEIAKGYYAAFNAKTPEAVDAARAQIAKATESLITPNQTTASAQARAAQTRLEALNTDRGELLMGRGGDENLPDDIQNKLNIIDARRAVEAGLIARFTHLEGISGSKFQDAVDKILGKDRGERALEVDPAITFTLGLPTDTTIQQADDLGLQTKLTTAQKTALGAARTGATIFLEQGEALARQIVAGGNASVGMAGGTARFFNGMIEGSRGIFALAANIAVGDAKAEEYLVLRDVEGNVRYDDQGEIMVGAQVDLSDAKHYEEFLNKRGFSPEKLGLNADEAARIKARVVAMAFALARSKEGGRLTDQDIRFAFDQMGISSDADQFAKVLRQTIADVHDEWRIKVMSTLHARPVSMYLDKDDVAILGGAGTTIHVNRDFSPMLNPAVFAKLSPTAQLWIQERSASGHPKIFVGGVKQ